MENSKIEIQQESGRKLDFNINSEIQKGLYLTMDKDLIDENIKTFNIDIEAIPNKVASTISKRNHIAIITIVVDENRKYQYLVGADLDFEKIEKMVSKEMPEQMKGMIKEAHLLAQKE